MIYQRYVKRALDIILSLIGLIVLAIPMLIIAIVIKFDSKGPVIFKQERLGLHGKTFEMYKFRTMYVGAEAQGVYSDKNDPRITRAAKILHLRGFLDELPQMLNCLQGTMSFIGPRPPLTYHPWPLEEYTEEQKKMFDVRPGITGWAQVHGRKDVEWSGRIALNVYYATHVSLWTDLKVIILTVKSVITNADNENKGATVVAQNSLEIQKETISR